MKDDAIKALCLVAVMTLGGCATATPMMTPNGQQALAPASLISAPEAVSLVASEQNGAIRGTFVMTVASVGQANDTVFLDSEPDYRNPHNLAIAIPIRLAEKYAAIHGGTVQDLLKGRRIFVTGVARRVRIFYFEDGKPTGRYYYQTHLSIQDI